MQVRSTRQAAVRCFFYRHRIVMSLYLFQRDGRGRTQHRHCTSAKPATAIPPPDIQKRLLKYHRIKTNNNTGYQETCAITSPSFSAPSPNSAPEETQPETSRTAEHPSSTSAPSVLPLSQRRTVRKHHHNTIYNFIPLVHTKHVAEEKLQTKWQISLENKLKAEFKLQRVDQVLPGPPLSTASPSLSLVNWAQSCVSVMHLFQKRILSFCRRHQRWWTMSIACSSG